MKERITYATCGKRPGFTLIELLVVISIIALLISILLSTLATVKRQILVTECSANLKAQTIGLTAFAVEDSNGHYPPGSENGQGDMKWLWGDMPPYTDIFPDRDAALATWNEMILGGTWEILWCPLVEERNAIIVGGDPNYPELFFDSRGAARGNYAGGYYRFHNTEIFDAANQVWINSGNSDLHGPPLGPNSSRDAILNDIIDAESTHVWHNHIGGFDPVFRGSAAEIVANAWRTENNVAYSDGHVETHGNSYMVAPTIRAMRSGRAPTGCCDPGSSESCFRSLPQNTAVRIAPGGRSSC